MRLRRPAIAFVAAFCALAAVTLPATQQKRRTAATGRTEILWDRYGVPHIFAADDAALFRAFGWAQMEAHGNLILRLYAQARGRGAEFFGPSLLDSDKWIRQMGVPGRAQEWYAQQEPVERTLLDAFVNGVNAYAAAHPERLDPDARAVLPITGADVLAHDQRVLLFEFVTSRDRVAATQQAWEKGSNAWAIAPAHTAAGRSILVANPHLGWSDLYLWFEAQLTSPSVEGYGAALVGQPLLGIGFNDDLGWTHTSNAMDGEDTYELTLDGEGYRWDGTTRPFEVSSETIRVKQDNGSLTEQPLVIRRSIHGPVVAEKSGKALALRVAGTDQPHMVGQYWQMIRAHSLPEFKTAIARLQNPFFTIIYADRTGHIMHVFGGRTPVRPAGPYNWSGIVPGDTSKTLWTTTHAFKDLPQVVDPPSGWLQNANDPPWTTTFPPPLKPGDFPPYMAPRAMSFRAQRSARMLAEDPHLTFDKVVEDKLSTRMELADRVLPDLIAAANARGGSAAEAAAILERWDRSADAASRGSVLFEAWFRELAGASGRAGLFAVRWNPDNPRVTPSGLLDPALAAKTLETAAQQVRTERGAADVPWGEVYRLRRDEVDLPGNGGPGDLGIFRVVGYRKDPDGRFAAVGGDSYVAIIEFGPRVRAMSLVTTGNSSVEGSPHRTDQLKLFAQKKLKPVWRSLLEIEANLESRETIK